MPIAAVGAHLVSLTERQRDCLEFLAQRPDASQREIAQALGIGSSSSSHRLVSALEERGYIRRLGGRARGIEVLHLPPPAPKRWTTEQGLAFARAWRIKMKPHFDGIYGPEPGRRSARRLG